MYTTGLSLPSHKAWNCRSQRWEDGHVSLCRRNAAHLAWICSRKQLRDPDLQSGWKTQQITPNTEMNEWRRQTEHKGRVFNNNVQDVSLQKSSTFLQDLNTDWKNKITITLFPPLTHFGQREQKIEFGSQTCCPAHKWMKGEKENPTKSTVINEVGDLGERTDNYVYAVLW